MCGKAARRPVKHSASGRQTAEWTHSGWLTGRADLLCSRVAALYVSTCNRSGWLAVLLVLCRTGSFPLFTGHQEVKGCLGHCVLQPVTRWSTSETFTFTRQKVVHTLLSCFAYLRWHICVFSPTVIGTASLKTSQSSNTGSMLWFFCCISKHITERLVKVSMIHVFVSHKFLCVYCQLVTGGHHASAGANL